VGDKFVFVEQIIRSNTVGCESLMAKLVEILDRPATEELPCGRDIVRLELCLIKDAGAPVASFCNHFEGDGFLSPFVFDRWNSVNSHVTNICNKYKLEDYDSPLRALAIELAPDDPVRQQFLVTETVKKVVPIARKLGNDTRVRLAPSLQVFRGCRMLSFTYIKENTLEAIREEFDFTLFLPIAYALEGDLKRELRTYKEKADRYEGDDAWGFWRTYYNVLPTWYKVAADVALVMSSSAAVERVFSLLNTRFTAQQTRCLHDYKEASIMITYNERYRAKIQYP
jgi:hAT family C-terminal dimerisation region